MDYVNISTPENPQLNLSQSVNALKVETVWCKEEEENKENMCIVV